MSGAIFGCHVWDEGTATGTLWVEGWGCCWTPYSVRDSPPPAPRQRTTGPKCHRCLREPAQDGQAPPQQFSVTTSNHDDKSEDTTSGSAPRLREIERSAVS